MKSRHIGQWIALVLSLAMQTAAIGQDKIGVRVPDGFQVSLFADDNLAHDIYSMTIDSFGRVVVSGRGYVKILIDSDGDGKADQVKQFADGPKTGAQGMCFHGRDLLCIGDAGLLRYRDRDGDDQADGPPDVFLKFKAGGEHHAHAIRKGPDGWWYIIAGNHAGITGKYASLKTSPIKNPNSGTLMRLQPDLAAGEIIADGFRNAYDFAFNRQGDIFTYDSDGERDVSLPWYRPTRVFHVLPGSNAGWFSRSWKRPDHFLDMPPVVASFGRGSPTGVAVYRHRQFPAEFDNAIFVLDWTFGRVMAVPLKRNGSSWAGRPIRFMTGVGQFGFAPTDVEVGRDGSLFVSVGGRGTRGGVFRVTYQKASAPPKVSKPTTIEQKLTRCLDAQQPLSSWSRAQWVPLAKELGRTVFDDAARNQELPAKWRIRGIEILTELYGGLNGETIRVLASTKSAEVRARAIWSLGRTQAAGPNTEVVRRFLNDDDPLVGRFALQALLGAVSGTDFDRLVPGLARQLGSDDRFNRQAAARIVTKLDGPSFKKLSLAASKSGWQAGLSNAVGYLARKPGFNQYAFKIGLPVLEGQFPIGLKRQAVRLMQLGLGDVGPNGKRPPVFDGYANRLDLKPHERDLDPVRIQAANAFPTGDHDLDFELARLLAMLSPYNAQLLDKILSQITDRSHPVDDIHYLIVAARIGSARTAKQRQAIAKALVDLESKIKSRQLNQDSNWDDRIGELYQTLVKLDPGLPELLLTRGNFGRPGHVIYLSEVPEDLAGKAIAAFERSVQRDDDYPWTNDVVFIFGESSKPEHRELVRKQFGRFSVRDSVLLVLATNPEQQDRQKFVAGLESPHLEVMTACVDALGKLASHQSPDEQVALLRAVRRLGQDKREYPLREKVVKLLRRNNGQQFGYQLGTEGHRPQNDAIAKWTTWISQKFPEQAARSLGGSQSELKQLKNRLAEVDWNQADRQHGQQLFVSRSCAQCHGGRRALGPDLAGVAGRFSRDDLFTAIALPNRDVSPRYQTTLIQTTAGKVYTGLIVYQSVDGLLLRNARNQTFRIEAKDIELRRTLPESLMPNGLLKDLKPQDLADLYAYIRSLGANTADSGRRDVK